MGILLHSLRRRVWPRNGKRQSVLPVNVNGRRFKRVMCGDSHQAQAIAACLEAFGPSPHLPTVVLTTGKEVWVDYLAGRPFRPDDGSDLDCIYAFYGHLYNRRPYQQALEDTVYPERLSRDLWVLQEVGALDSQTAARLLSRAESHAPEQVWIGFDYDDARLDNFLLGSNGTPIGIDVENLKGDTLLGMGLASARLHWAHRHGPPFARMCAENGLSDIATSFPFIDFCYRAAILKQRHVKRKRSVRGKDAAELLEAAFQDPLEASDTGMQASVSARVSDSTAGIPHGKPGETYAPLPDRPGEAG